MAGSAHHISLVFIELGACVVGLAILARIASSFGFSSIPLFLVGGLAFGNGGFLPLGLTSNFVHIGAEIGVLLLLLMLGLESTGDELRHSLVSGLPSGLADFALNFTPGLVTGLLLHWPPIAAALLGGVTWVSSSGIIAKLMTDQNRLGNPETPSLLSVLVLEDLAMAIYLPLIAALLIGGTGTVIAVSVGVAILTVATVLFVALRFGGAISEWVAHESDEVVLLTTFGLTLLVAGVAQRLQVSSAIGAFMVGVALSGPLAKQSKRLLAPLRDLFSAIFFFFFGLEVDPATLPPVGFIALALGVVTVATKILTGYLATRNSGVDRRSRLAAGVLLVSRGEFSIVIAGLGAALEPELGALAAAYVTFLAVLGPVLARLVK